MNGEMVLTKSNGTMMPEQTQESARIRKTGGKIALAMVVVILLSAVMQIVWGGFGGFYHGLTGKPMQESLFMLLGSFIPVYVIALPVGMLILRKLRADAPANETFGAGRLFRFWLMTLGVSYAGNVAGNILSALLSGGTAENALIQLATEDTNLVLKILLMVIAGPFLEELFFRKLIIDRTRRFHEKGAVVFSAVLFSLYHMNLFQLFYTFGMGLLWGYIYLKSGKIRYSFLLHVITNFSGLILAGWVTRISHVEEITALSSSPDELMALLQQPGYLTGFAIFIGYALLLFALFVAGIVLLIKGQKTWAQLSSDNRLSTKTALRSMLLTLQMAVFTVLCALVMGVALAL